MGSAPPRQQRQTPRHMINTSTTMVEFDNHQKSLVIEILKEGWKPHRDFQKSVEFQLPQARGSSMEEILYAVFGFEVADFVEFKATRRSQQVRLRLEMIGVL